MPESAPPMQINEAASSWQWPEHAAFVRQHLDLVLDNVPVLIAYYDSPSVRCVFANQLYAQANGWQVDQIVGMHCREIIGQNAWRQIEPHVNEVLSGRGVRYEREINVSGQPKRYVEVSLQPHFVDTPDGRQQRGAFVLINDITQRHQAENDVLEREQRAQRFIDAASEGIVFYENGIIRDCNEAFVTMLERDREQLLGSDILQLFSKEDRAIAAKHIHLGLDRPYPARLPLLSGKWLDAEIRGKAVQLEGRRASVATVRDVSQLTHVNKALMRSQARYRSLVDNSDQAAIFILDRKIVYSNPAAQRMFQLTEPQMMGLESTYLLHPEDRAYALMRRKQMIAGDPDRTAVLRNISPPGKQLESYSKIGWVRLHGSILEWEGRAGVLIFLTDITAWRESEEQMRKALAQEKELGDLKTRFVSMASHEFRTPLATIQTSSELLEHYFDRMSPQERSEAIVDIQLSVQRMQAMMESFLAFGRMDSGSTLCVPKPLCVCHQLQGMLHEARAGANQHHHIELSVLPPLNQSTNLLLDEMLLRHMVINLITNACKYSPEGSSVTVSVSARLDLEIGMVLLIAVQDQGIGIPQEEHPFLFNSFHRASNAGAVSGTGLGLAIVDRAARAHGGRVSVASTLGQGSVFTLELPWRDV